MPSTPDQIQKTTLLRAPLETVWAAVSDSPAFGTWFGARVDGPFVAGEAVDAVIAPTSVDEKIAGAQEPYAGTAFKLYVEEVAAPTRLSFRWHPGAEASSDDDPTTLVVFELRAEEDGTRLTITESGFAGLPLERRAKAFADNDGGWAAQLTLVEKYLAQRAAA